MNNFEQIYHSAKQDKYIKYFADFCRYALAASFFPAGLVKIFGKRFAEGIPSGNALGQYFDALLDTGFYYTFIGWIQIITSVLLLVRKTSLLGALMYFPIILNILVLTYATRFSGTRIVTMLFLGSVFLLLWDYQKLKTLFSTMTESDEKSGNGVALSKEMRILFFMAIIFVLAMIAVFPPW